MDRHSVADCYNINKNTTQYQPQVYSHYSYKTQIDNERYPSHHSFNQPTSLIESRSKDLSTTEAFFFKVFPNHRHRMYAITNSIADRGN
jgi:hypothetical protein